MKARQYTKQKRSAVSEGEKSDVCSYLTKSVKKENDSAQKQEMIVSRDHVFRPEIHVWNQVRTCVLLQKGFVFVRYAMGEAGHSEEQRQEQPHHEVTSEN